MIASAAWAATLGAAGDASAERIAYIFTAEDGFGRVAELRLIADAGMGPTDPRQIPGVPGGSSEFTAGRLGPMRAVAFLDGVEYEAYEGAEPSDDLVEAVVSDAWLPPDEFLYDGFALAVIGDGWDASVNLMGSDPSAILTHLALPRSLDLDRFGLTRSLQLNDFRGTITAIVVVPEPGSLALAGLGLLGVAGLAGARRARRAA